jgi:hypothetical protein
VSASCGATYSAVEKTKSGDVFRKAKADGSAARARAPSSIFAMMLRDVLLEVMFAMCSSGVAATGCLSH